MIESFDYSTAGNLPDDGSHPSDFRPTRGAEQSQAEDNGAGREKQYRVLSLDGGGIRGIITAIWLQRLEEILQRPLRDFFDLIAGTSTGAILACAIAAERPASQIVELYRDKGADIFPQRALLKRFRLGRHLLNLFGPRYSGHGLRNSLRDVFLDSSRIPLKLGSLRPNTMVLAYDAFRRNPVVFKSYVPYHSGINVADACQCSSSAPTYFPASEIVLEKAILPMIDGGVVANNPSACALAEVVALHNKPSIFCLRDEVSIVIASFGTGSFTRPIPRHRACRWGIWGWMGQILDVMFDGSSDAAHFICRKILPDENYFRFQAKIDNDYARLDNASPENINSLIGIATQYLDHEGGHDLLVSLARVLRGQLPPRAVHRNLNPVA